MLSPLKRDGRVINVWTTIANNPKLAEKWLPFAFYFLTESTLPRREREMLMLRSAWLCQCEDIFGQHTLLGKSAGLSEGILALVFMGIVFAVGWTISTMLTNLLFTPEFFIKWYYHQTDSLFLLTLRKEINRDTIALLILLFGEVMFYYLYLKGQHREAGEERSAGKSDAE